MNRPTVPIQYVTCNVRDRGQVNLSPKPRGMVTSSQRGSSLNFLNENLQKKKIIAKEQSFFSLEIIQIPQKNCKKICWPEKQCWQKFNIGPQKCGANF